MVRRHSDRRLALETGPDVTNRERAIELAKQACFEGEGPGLDWTKAAHPIESALNAEHKAGELEGQIRTLEWVRREGDDWQPFTRDTITAELDRLRAEKEKLG